VGILSLVVCDLKLNRRHDAHLYSGGSAIRSVAGGYRDEAVMGKHASSSYTIAGQYSSALEIVNRQITAQQRFIYSSSCI
jgi:hypothetical protein